MQEEMEDVPAEPFNPDDYAAAETVDGSMPALAEGEEDPLISAGLFEGDMVGFDPSVGANAIRDDRYRWPQNTVPYEISGQFNQREKSIILQAMEEFRKKTCIRFKDRTTERDHIYIYKGRGCSSNVGRVGGRQYVSLSSASRCVYTPVVIHELMHAVGFHHEQSRTDRDDWVTIYRNNIIPGKEGNFEKYQQDHITHLQEQYDYCSVMHYWETIFSKNGQKTIEAKKNTQCGHKIGEGQGFSATDIRKINKLYKCSGGGGGSGTTTTTTPRPKPSGCQDNHANCEVWARGGYCYHSYLKANCRKSCNRCSSNCVDLNSRCPRWKSYCDHQQLVSYMNKYCAKVRFSITYNLKSNNISLPADLQQMLKQVVLRKQVD